MTSSRATNARLTAISAFAAAGLVVGLFALPTTSASASSGENGVASVSNSLLSRNGTQFGNYFADFEVKSRSIEYRAGATELQYRVGDNWKGNANPAHVTYEFKLIRNGPKNTEYVVTDSREVFTQTTTAPEVSGVFPLPEAGNYKIQLWIRAENMYWPGKHSAAIGNDVIFFGDIK